MKSSSSRVWVRLSRFLTMMSDARMSGVSIANVELKPAILRLMTKGAACLLTGLLAMTGFLAAQAPPADLIIHNAVIYTVNPQRPKAAAIAVRGDKIAAVGDETTVMALRGPKTRVLDAGGR